MCKLPTSKIKHLISVQFSSVNASQNVTELKMLHMLKYAIIGHFTEYGYSVPKNKYWLTLQVGKIQSFQTHWKLLQIGKMGRSRIARLRFIHPLILLIDNLNNVKKSFPMYTHSGICNYLWFYTWLLRSSLGWCCYMHFYPKLLFLYRDQLDWGML